MSVATACPDMPDMSLAECLRRLEQIARDLGRELDLERALGLYEEGCRIHARAQSIVDRVRGRIEELSGDFSSNAEDGSDSRPRALPEDGLDMDRLQ